MNAKRVLNTMVIISIIAIYPKAQENRLFNNSFVHKIVITPFYEGFQDTLTTNYILSFGMGQTQIRAIPYSQASLTIDGITLDTIGIRYKGFNSWWHSTKKPLKIDINKYNSDLNYFGLKKFNLHNSSGDPSFLRENISYHLLHKLGIKVPRTSYTQVFIDTTLLGLYRIVEQVDNAFLDANYGNHDGNLYVQQSANTAGYTLEWKGQNANEYMAHLSLENHQTKNDWSDLIHFLDVLNNTSDAHFKDSILSVFDVNEYLKILATDVTLHNADFYGNSGRNYYLYHDKSGDKKFHWIPWDYNLSFFSNPEELNINPNLYPLLIKRILKEKDFNNMYLQEFCKLQLILNQTFIDSFILSDTTLIRKYLIIDNNLDFALEAFDKNQNEEWQSNPGLKPFINQRIGDINNLLNTENISCSTDILKDDLNNDITLFPIPANNFIKIYIPIEKEIQLTLFNLEGIALQNTKFRSTERLDVSKLNNGMYLLKLIIDKKQFTKLILIQR